jgi:hypothetical protein
MVALVRRTSSDLSRVTLGALHKYPKKGTHAINFQNLSLNLLKYNLMFFSPLRLEKVPMTAM